MWLYYFSTDLQLSIRIKDQDKKPDLRPIFLGSVWLCIILQGDNE